MIVTMILSLPDKTAEGVFYVGQVYVYRTKLKNKVKKQINTMQKTNNRENFC